MRGSLRRRRRHARLGTTTFTFTSLAVSIFLMLGQFGLLAASAADRDRDGAFESATDVISTNDGSGGGGSAGGSSDDAAISTSNVRDDRQADGSGRNSRNGTRVPAGTTGYDVVLTSPTPPAASTTFTWTISGDKGAQGGEISHIELSGCWTGAQIQSVSSSAGTATFNATTGLVKVENVDDGDTPFTVTIVFTQSFPSATTGTTVFVKTGGGPDEGGTANVGGPVCQQPTVVDLSISKGPATQTINDGGTATFDITVTNQGNAQATSVVVTDTLPSGLTPATVQFGATTASLGNCTNATPISGQTVTCNVGNLAAGASVVVRITATETGSLCQYQNSASVAASNETGTQHPNTSGPVTVNVNCALNLSISKAGPPSATVGSSFNYTITVTNTGTLPATDVTVSDNVSGALTVTSVTFSTSTPVTNGTCPTSQNVSCSIGTLQVGQSATVTIAVTVGPNACPQVQNTATVTATGLQPSTRTSNTVTTTVPCPAGQPSLSLNKTGTATVTNGGAVTYTVTVTNSGSGAATSVVITDNLDDSFTSVTASSTIGTCLVGAGNLVTCNVGTLNAGQSATITINANAPAGTCPTITNQATGTHAGGTIPPSPTVTTTVTGCAGPEPEISVLIEKTNDANEDGIFTNNEEAKTEGRAVDFLLVITNTSDETVEITDLTDSFEQTVIDLLDAECSNLDGAILDPGESVECTFTLSNYSPEAETTIVDVAEVCVVMVGGTQTACDTNPSRVSTAEVLGETVTPTSPPPTVTPPGGVAFTGAGGVVPLATVALLMLTLGTGLLWAGRRRGSGDA